jgi:cyclophilin family peptidyl-prolyl cis-trans isomerase
MTATVLKTSELLTIKVHTVNANGTPGQSGEMDFLLLDDYAPNNIAHITSLVNSGFYNGLTFHRILQDFMIQGGDPTGTGSGGSGPDGAKGAVQDDEFNVDIRYTTSGLLALANSGVDTNDCQFFITANTFRGGDYQYTIIGKLVAGDDIRQLIAGVPVEDNGNGEVSKPVNPPIIDSVSIVSNTKYGLVLLTTTSGATAGASGDVSVVGQDGRIGNWNGTSESVLSVTLAADAPSLQDRPAFVDQTMPDVNTTVNTAVTFPIDVKQGDPGVSLSYGAGVATANTTNLTCNSATDGSANATATPSGGIMGVYSLVVGVWRNSTDSSSNTNFDSQHVALFVHPLAPTTLTLTSPNVPPGGASRITTGLTFHVTGVTPGLTVSIFADGQSAPIGSAVASGNTVDIVTTVPLLDGNYTFTAKQAFHYDDTVVGNRTIPAGDLYSDPSPSVGPLRIDSPPTAIALLNDVKKIDTGIPGVTFVVTYSNPGDTINLYTIDNNDILVTDVNGFSQLASLISAVPSTSGSSVTATYRFDAPGGVWNANSLVKYTISMVANQVSDSHSTSVAAGTLLIFDPSDTTPPTVIINQAAGQADPALSAPVLFTAVFSERVTNFSASKVIIGGTTGATTATITPVGANGDTYTVAISGMTQDGTLTVSLAAEAAEDIAGNLSVASTSTDDSVAYVGSPLSVTINQAATQPDPTMASTIHFTVVFNKPVSDFAAADVTLGGTVLGNLVATISGSGTSYDVAVTGMASTGKLTASIAAGTAHDSNGKANLASTSKDNSVQFNLAAMPTFRLTAPASGTFNVGQTVVIAWAAANVIGGTKISLCYDADKTPNRNEHWIEIDQVSAANGYSTYTTWNTSGVAPGTYYIGGYLWSGGKAIRSYCSTPITIVAPKPTFRLATPTSGSFSAGQTVTVTWAASNMAANATVSICYDTDTVFNRNEKYIEIDKVAANNLQNGYGGYSWDTTGMQPGTYYVGGYLWSNGKPTYSHLTQPITIVGSKATFRITAPTSGSFAPGQQVKIYWTANNFADGSTVSLCYDQDTAINGNEHYIEINQATMAATDAGNYRSYTWTVPALAPGKYYLGGYLWSNGKPTFSHLTQPITITAAPLMVDASTPPSGVASALTAAQLQPIVVEAERRLTAATGIQVAAAMTGVSINIGDLPANMLGEAAGTSIYVSRTAAGYGWFVDSTPADDSEFSDRLGPYALAAPSGSPAANRVDLLTTVMHEMTHLLGYGHSDSLDLMSAALPLGERRLFDDQLLPSISSQNRGGSFSSSLAETSAVDQVFASSGDARSWVLL